MPFLLFKPKIPTHPLMFGSFVTIFMKPPVTFLASNQFFFSSPLGSRGTLYLSILCYFVVDNTISHHISSFASEFVEDPTDFTEELRPSSLIWVGPAMSLSLANDIQMKMTCHSHAKALFVSVWLQPSFALLNPKHCPKTEALRAKSPLDREINLHRANKPSGKLFKQGFLLC